MAGKLSGLSSRARLQYEERGYYFPVAVLDSSEVAEFRAHFIDHLESNRKVLKALPPKASFVPGHLSLVLRPLLRGYNKSTKLG